MRHFKRTKTLKVTLGLIVATLIFGSIAAAVKTTFLILLFTVLTAITFVSLFVYAFIIAVPDYNFSIELNDKHVIYKDSVDNGIVFDRENFRVTRKNRKTLVLEDKFNRFKLPYSRELYGFLMVI